VENQRTEYIQTTEYKRSNELINAYSDKKRYEKACDTLDEGFEDAFQYTVAGKGHSRLKSTNMLERFSINMVNEVFDTPAGTARSEDHCIRCRRAHGKGKYFRSHCYK